MGDHAAIHALLSECRDLARGRASKAVQDAWDTGLRDWEDVPVDDSNVMGFMARRLLPLVAAAKLEPAPIRRLGHLDQQEADQRRRYEDARSALRAQLSALQRSPLQQYIMEDAISPYSPALLRGAFQGMLIACVIAVLLSVIFIPALLLIPAAIAVWAIWRWGAAKHLRRRLHLLNYGRSVSARIQRKEKIYGGVYQLVLAYEWNHLDFLTPGTVSLGSFSALCEGDTLPIRIDPQQPNIWMVAAQDEHA